MGMSEAAEGHEQPDAAAMAALFEAGLAKLRAQTPAKVGDKTMLDALVPAVEALRGEMRWAEVPCLLGLSQGSGVWRRARGNGAVCPRAWRVS